MNRDNQTSAASFVLRGDICSSRDRTTFDSLTGGYAVCVDGVCRGVFQELPERFAALPVIDHSGRLILPGLVDLHTHAPQFANRALGLDTTLLEWLNSRTFPEEGKYDDKDYAEKAYSQAVQELRRGPNTRVCLFGTVHVHATTRLMELLEDSGLVSLVGKVNMDRNAPDFLREKSADASVADTLRWLEQTAGRFRNTSPILTPRFIPSCSNDLLRRLAGIRREHDLPLQSHLSENRDEGAWVRELRPDAGGYADAYDKSGLLEGGKCVMAHCVWSDEAEMELLRRRGVFVAHCPQSNTNLASGIAPVRRFLERGLRVGLGSDVAAGCHTSIFRAMADAIQASKLYSQLVDDSAAPLTLAEAFWLGTAGGGEFFGNVGMFRDGYEFDALVVDDAALAAPFALTLPERLARVMYLSDDRHIREKYVRGKMVAR